MICLSFRRIVLAVFLLTGVSANALADTFLFVVQPFLPSAETKKAYAPMAKYLSDVTGHTIKLITSPNFLAYWQTMKTGEYDLLLDAAHLTDYRAQKMNYKVLAKVLDVVSLTLVTGEDIFIFEPSELVGKRIASLASPSRGAVVLDEFFPNPVRQPILIEVTNAGDAVQKVLDKKASGAIIPSPLVGGFPQLNVVKTTEQWPHIALSASSKMPADVVKKIQDAMVNASKTPEGQKMLEEINFPGFELADAKRYKGYSDVLKGVWGY